VLVSASLTAHRLKDIRIVPLAIATYVLTHLGYGIGFIMGVTRRHE
jgi:hypothetical protein